VGNFWTTATIRRNRSGRSLPLSVRFAPFISAPIFGRVTLFQQGKGDGVVLMAVALIAGVFSMFGRYGFFLGEWGTWTF
jgi:hypothetical protein